MQPWPSTEFLVIDDPRELQIFIMRSLVENCEDNLLDLMVKVDEGKVKKVYRQLVLNPDAIDKGIACLKRANGSLTDTRNSFASW